MRKILFVACAVVYAGVFVTSVQIQQVGCPGIYLMQDGQTLSQLNAGSESQSQSQSQSQTQTQSQSQTLAQSQTQVQTTAQASTQASAQASTGFAALLGKVAGGLTGGGGGGEAEAPPEVKPNIMPNINIIDNARQVVNPGNPMKGLQMELSYDRGAIDGSFSPGGAFGAGGAYGLGGAYGTGGAYGPPSPSPIGCNFNPQMQKPGGMGGLGTNMGVPQIGAPGVGTMGGNGVPAAQNGLAQQKMPPYLRNMGCGCRLFAQTSSETEKDCDCEQLLSQTETDCN